MPAPFFRCVGFGTDVTATAVAPCYCQGTLILTEHGELPVEALRIGAGLVTRFGVRPIRWIGRRSYAGAFIDGNPDMLPVCIKAGALDHCRPRPPRYTR